MSDPRNYSGKPIYKTRFYVVRWKKVPYDNRDLRELTVIGDGFALARHAIASMYIYTKDGGRLGRLKQEFARHDVGYYNIMKGVEIIEWYDRHPDKYSAEPRQDAQKQEQET